MRRASRDGELLGAHVSSHGGVALAPARGAAIGATAIQVFTKTPQQWREPTLSDRDIVAFRAAVKANGLGAVVSHESYLNNLASPDDKLRDRSVRAFTHELQRCRALGIPWVVTHPGNYIDDRDAGLARNARGYAECLAGVAGDVGLLIEGMAGAGTALGSTFEELRALRDELPAALRERVSFCLDTAHLHAAGYDVVAGLEAVWERFDREIGIARLKCLHLNDSKAAAGSRLDRHQWIGEGTLGPGPFRDIMRDPRFGRVIKIIETPKGDDPVRHDRRMLRRLRAYARRLRERPSNEPMTQTVGRA
ncbi:MAG TPA: deoxyribonuclease IV [Gemmatimonadales bacterium]|nr:deoxyribonuclease IV [Gemmatimonadales bacterium]